MNALTILERCKRGEYEIKRMQEGIDRLHEIAEGAGVARMDVTGVGGSGAYYADRLLDIMGSVTERENELEQRKQALALERVCIMQLCEKMKQPKADICYKYFVQGVKMKVLTAEMQYARSYISQLKTSIIKEFEQIKVDDFFPAWYMEKFGFDEVTEWRAAQ